jgi:hypothetical protein
MKKNLEYSFICGSQIKFLLMKMILRPAHQFEFDMPALDVFKRINDDSLPSEKFLPKGLTCT